MEIQVGEYVRTNRGIGKILEIKTVNTKIDRNHDKSYKLDILKNIWFSKSHFINHSFEPRDLIEEGDLVQIHDRGNRIYQVDRNYQGKLAIIDVGWNEYETLYNENIKNIVTKEQFESIKYEV